MRKLIRLSFRDFIFADSSPIAIINDVNIVLRIKIFVGRVKSTKTTKILPRETFQLYDILLFVQQKREHSEMAFLTSRSASKHILFAFGVDPTARDAIEG